MTCKCTIVPHLPEGTTVDITLAGETKRATPLDKALVFTVPKGEYTVTVTEVHESTYDKRSAWLFYLLTLPLRMLLAPILAWLSYDDESPFFVDAFLLTAASKLSLTEDAVTLPLYGVKKERQKGFWAAFEGIEVAHAEYRFCDKRLTDHMCDVLKNITSLFLSLALLFAFMLYQNVVYASNGMLAVIIPSAMLVGLIALFVYLVRRIYQEDAQNEQYIRIVYLEKTSE